MVGFTYMNSMAQTSNTATKTESIKGTVVDSSNGNPIGNIKVELKGTMKSTTTNSSGYFKFSNLKSGTYTLYVDAEGYKEYQQQVKLTNGSTQVTIKLEQASKNNEESMR